jgi:hypothetical protein
MSIDKTEPLGDQESWDYGRLKRNQHTTQKNEDHHLFAGKGVAQGEPRHGVNDDIGYDHNRRYKEAVPKIAKKGNPVVYVDVVKQIGILGNE